MKEVFQKRRNVFLGQCLKYLRYVFNDHFVLVLIFLTGFLMVQYSQLLRQFPSQTIIVDIILVLMIVVLLSLGRIATYLEAPDKLFYLPKEAEILQWLVQARRRAFVLWTIVQTAVMILLAPIFFKLGFSILTFSVLLLVLAGVKWLIIKEKSKVYFSHGKFSWDAAIAYETKRRQRVLKFFSLFTTVKGISTSVKRRSYLDGLLVLVKKTHVKTWSNLYLRAFLRSSDYFSLTLRLFGLSLLALILISNRLVAIGLTLVFNYLLLFQLLTLFRHFDYHYLTNLYPISEEQKAANLKIFLKKLSYLLSFLELILTFSWQGAVLLVLVTVIMTEWYLPYKINKMID